MEINLFILLQLVGFKKDKAPVLNYGCGSLMVGKTASINHLYGDMYYIKFHAWEYGCDGEQRYENNSTLTLSSRKAWEFLNDEFKFIKE